MPRGGYSSPPYADANMAHTYHQSRHSGYYPSSEKMPSHDSTKAQQGSGANTGTHLSAERDITDLRKKDKEKKHKKKIAAKSDYSTGGHGGSLQQSPYYPSNAGDFVSVPTPKKKKRRSVGGASYDHVEYANHRGKTKMGALLFGIGAQFDKRP